jgi:hypothetical protein
MKNLFILLLLPFLAAAQQQEVIDISEALVEENGIYYIVTTTKYAEGPPATFPTRIGDRQATLDYARNTAMNRQQEVAAAMKIAIVEKPLAIRQYMGIDTIVRDITGGDTTLFDLAADFLFPTFEGRYRLRTSTGSTNFTARMIRLPSGLVRMERESDQFRFPVFLYSPKNFRIQNLVVGSLPAAIYDVYETNEGRYQDENRILTIIKIE